MLDRVRRGDDTCLKVLGNRRIDHVRASRHHRVRVPRRQSSRFGALSGTYVLVLPYEPSRSVARKPGLVPESSVLAAPR
jgi:hypothetical protein